MENVDDQTGRDAPTVLNELLAAWSRAATPWNATELGSLYSEDACLFGGRPGHSIGRAEITRYFACYDGVILSASIKPLDQEFSAPEPHLVIAQGHVEFAFLLGTGNRTKSLLRSTLILKREGGRWRISHHHFSPIPETPPLGEK